MTNLNSQYDVNISKQKGNPSDPVVIPIPILADLAVFIRPCEECQDLYMKMFTLILSYHLAWSILYVIKEKWCKFKGKKEVLRTKPIRLWISDHGIVTSPLSFHRMCLDLVFMTWSWRGKRRKAFILYLRYFFLRKSLNESKIQRQPLWYVWWEKIYAHHTDTIWHRPLS